MQEAMLETMPQEYVPRATCAWNTPSVSWGKPGRRKSRRDSDTCRCARQPPQQGIRYIFLASKGPRKYTLYGKITCLNFRSKKFLGRKTTSTGTPAAENGCIRRSSARRAQPWPPEPPAWTEMGPKIAIYFLITPPPVSPLPDFAGEVCSHGSEDHACTSKPDQIGRKMGPKVDRNLSILVKK